MQVLPIDLTAIVAIVMGISIILIPVLGATARFALKPTVETLSRFFDSRGTEETVKILERRMAFLEQQMESVEVSVRRLVELGEFDQQLQAGTPPPGVPPAPGARPEAEASSTPRPTRSGEDSASSS